MTSTFNVEPSTQPPRSPKAPKWRTWLGLGVAGLVGGLWLMNVLEQQTFEKGMQAYNKGDCVAAMTQFERVIGDRTPSTTDSDDIVARAQAKKAECQAFQAATSNQASVAAQLGKTTQFIQKYPDSGLVADLRRTLDQRVKQTNAQSLATSATCQQLDRIKAANLMSAAPEKLPILYQTCGRLFASGKKLPEAIAVYEQFLSQFPNHPLQDTVKQAYAEALVQDGKAQGGGTIAPPGQIGQTSDGSTMVTIRNDSNEAIRIVFSGPTPRVEELPPCKNCEEYTPSNLPDRCPGKGTQASYTVESGTYQVMVKSIGTRRVKPFTGSWNLEGGSEYGQCFYIVREAAL